jgi:hypothetical protein
MKQTQAHNLNYLIMWNILVCVCAQHKTRKNKRERANFLIYKLTDSNAFQAAAATSDRAGRPAIYLFMHARV